MELWNEICFLVKQHRKPTSTERDFQIEAEHLFEKLGWSRFKGEIITQKVIPIGSAQNLRPDIIIAKDHKQIIVAELKKPNAEIVLRNSDQLVSYMLQLRLRFGLLIGDTLQVFYDVPEDNEKPVKVIEIPFTPDQEVGAELINILKKDSYSDERFAAWCKQKITESANAKEAARLMKLLISEDGNALYIEVLKNHLNTRFSEEVVTKVLENLLIRVEAKQQIPTKKANKISSDLSSTRNLESARSVKEDARSSMSGDTLSIVLIPESSSDFKVLLLQKKRANIITYYADGRVEKRIWDASNMSESSGVLNNLRSRPEFRNGEWQKNGIVKVVCAIED